jgi:hypothetical protein
MDVSDPRSPSYGLHRTLDELRALAPIPDSSVDAVTAFILAEAPLASIKVARGVRKHHVARGATFSCERIARRTTRRIQCRAHNERLHPRHRQHQRDARTTRRRTPPTQTDADRGGALER